MSLWSIDDEATMNLMTRFVTYYAAATRARFRNYKSVTPAVEEAMRQRNLLLSAGTDASTDRGMQGAEFDLRAAALEMRNKYGDPALWAGFVMYGLPTYQVEYY
jgi:CHAT domain-containing protein